MKKETVRNIELLVKDIVGVVTFKEIKTRINDGRISSHLELRLWGLSSIYTDPTYLKIIYEAFKIKKYTWLKYLNPRYWVLLLGCFFVLV